MTHNRLCTRCGPFGTDLVLFAVIAIMIVIEAFRQTKDRTLRLRDGKRPPITLAGEHQYHAFVSHIWSTGQDQAAVIKRQLLHLMPAAKVFLDVGHEQLKPPSDLP